MSKFVRYLKIKDHIISIIQGGKLESFEWVSELM